MAGLRQRAGRIKLLIFANIRFMDRKTFLALMTLASSPFASPALAEQVRYAEATGNIHHISWDGFLGALYNVARAPDGVPVCMQAMMQHGYNKQEAAQIADTIKNIAQKADSSRAFLAVIEGRAPKGVELSPRETVLLRSVVARY